MAAASERANMIELAEYMEGGELKSKKDGINLISNLMSDFAIMDDLDRMESGQSSYRMYAHTKDSINGKSNQTLRWNLSSPWIKQSKTIITDDTEKSSRFS